jgi:Rieske Fe-S protein
MSDVAEISAPDETRRTRRRLIQAAAWLSFAPAALMLGWDLLRYLVPPIGRAAFRKVFVVRTPELPAEDVHEMVDLNGRPLAIIQGPGGSPLAISLVCTHLGCRVHWQPKARTFLCPCHMGIFDEQGRVLSGPPPSPLPQYKVSVEAENLFVHLPEI